MSENDNDSEATPTGKKHLLVIGVNSSGNLPVLSSLKYAEQSAEGISWHLRQEECGFESFRGRALRGNAASTQAVRRAVSELINKSEPEDLLLFYFIGHSYATSTNEGDKIYLVTADFDPDDVTHQPNAHLSLDWIWKTFLDNENLNNVIVILDCCNAGGALNPLSPSGRVMRSMQAFLDDLSRHQRAGQASEQQSTRTWAIIVSTEANAPAYEGNGHTRMTGLILDVLKGKDQTALDRNGDLTLFDLFKYLQRRMPGLGPQRQNSIMRGTFSTENLWILARDPLPTNHNSIILAQDPVRTTLESFRGNSGRLPFFDETICQQATTANLDMDQVRTFLQRPLVYRQDDYHVDYNEQQQLEAFGLLHGEHPSYGALLCFGRHPFGQITGAYTRCIYWRDSKRLNGKLYEREYRGSLLEQFAQAYDFLIQHLGYQVSKGGQPEPKKLYARVLEEALANALIHREYVRKPGNTPRSEEVKIEIFRDRIEILSPGGPPLDIAILQKADEQHPASHPRNPQIMRIFYLAGHVERAGTGIMRMQRWMQEADLPGPDMKLDEMRQTFFIILHRPFVDEIELDNTIKLVVDETELDKHKKTVVDEIESDNSTKPVATNPELDNPEKQTPPGDKGGKNSSTLQSGTPITWVGSSQSYRLARIVLLIVLSIALVFGLGASAFTFVPQWLLSLVPASTTIEIASELPTSGVDTTIGLPQKYGVQMAIDDANNSHMLPGYALVLTPYDDVGRNDRHDPQKGANNLTKAIADNLVAGVVGPYNSAVAVAELPIANRAPIALISPSNTYACLTKDVKADPDCSGSHNIKAQMRPTGRLTYFRLSTSDDRQGKAAAYYFFNVQHYHNVQHPRVLLFEDTSDPYNYGIAQVFQDEWTRLGGQVKSRNLNENTSSVQDYQKVLLKEASFQPDLIYFAGNDPNGDYMLQALSTTPQLKSVTFAGAASIMDNGFQQVVAGLHPGAPIYASSPLQDPAHSFEQNYIAHGYKYYRPYAASAYDATMMLIQAIKIALQQKGISTPHGVQDQAGARQFRLAILHALAYLSHTGITGTQSFDANGDTTNHTISFYQVDLSNSPPDWQLLQQVTG